jgi:hypothetical protein
MGLGRVARRLCRYPSSNSAVHLYRRIRAVPVTLAAAGNGLISELGQVDLDQRDLSRGR